MRLNNIGRQTVLAMAAIVAAAVVVGAIAYLPATDCGQPVTIGATMKLGGC